MAIFEVLNNQQSYFNRYFRRNEVSTDYATIPTVSPDRIVMDVLPASGGLGLPTGAPAVTDNVLQTIDFAYSGSISELYKNGSDYFAGIIANVKLYAGGTLVRDYPLNDNSDILANRATSLGHELWGASNYIAANNATVSNIGERWSVQSPNGDASNYIDGARVNNFSGLVEGVTYIYKVDSDRPVNLAVYDSGYSLIASSSSNKPLVFTASGTNRVYVCPTDTNTAIIFNPSIRRADGYGTIINGNADDWGLFDRQANGDWKGNGLAVPPWDSVDQVLVTA